MKKEHNGERYILRLFNNSPEPGNAVLSLCGAHINLGFGRYEVKTVIYDGAKPLRNLRAYNLRVKDGNKIFSRRIVYDIRQRVDRQ